MLKPPYRRASSAHPRCVASPLLVHKEHADHRAVLRGVPHLLDLDGCRIDRHRRLLPQLRRCVRRSKIHAKYRRRIVEAGEGQIGFGAVLFGRHADRAYAWLPKQAARTALEVEHLGHTRRILQVGHDESIVSERRGFNDRISALNDQFAPVGLRRVRRRAMRLSVRAAHASSSRETTCRR